MFDEQFFFYWEDVDLCRTIEKNKFKIYLDMSAYASHVGEKSVKENITEKKRLAARPHSASDTELADHMILVDSIPKAIWRR